MELQIPTSKVAHLKSVSVEPASLDAPVGEDGDSASFGEIVGDENAVSPYENLRGKNLNSDLHAMVDSLDKREAEIIRLRFGLDGRSELTLEEVGRRFNVTRERIRQLEYIALGKMRRAMAKNEAVRNAEDVEQEERQRKRMTVIREFIESKSWPRARSPARTDTARRRRIFRGPPSGISGGAFSFGRVSPVWKQKGRQRGALGGRSL